ncbi:hepatocellular carcinoma-associated antigen 59-domain-containing protein [Podospora australis]|uniref:Hepatocellular carcinoma-associated antigen 59-domain-containing protein n=1 Tax=Podospora australis TaxID=1536484 RepID=A0AAN6X281_9PEZI|nr:hepatocellular carcinoma-associated antigen 59-domain-containing protein [Podospora australis]
MEHTNSESAPEPQVIFRSRKNRKSDRSRPFEIENANSQIENATEAAPLVTETSAQHITTTDEDEEKGLSVAEAIRLRNARKHKHGGVGFRAGSTVHGENNGPVPEERSLVPHGSAEPESVIIGGITKRFAPQTGLSGELVNKHMEEYVESELARRKRQAAELSAQQEMEANNTGSTTGATMSNTNASVPGGPVVDSQRALQGKLFEVDLGDEARERTIQMTERARRRLQGQIDEEDESSDSRQRKVRIGPDGKPWRSRNRRGSDALKRDQQVEEFLSENKLDIYDVSTEQTPAVEDGEELAADDRIAEEFRREFMDAMAQRYRKKRTAVPVKPGPKPVQTEVLKGPKLGGSRNARAAMREILLKEQASKRR